MMQILYDIQKLIYNSGKSVWKAHDGLQTTAQGVWPS